MLTVETERETDGRWIAEIALLPGTMTYGVSREDAIARVEALALSVCGLLRVGCVSPGR